MPRRPPPQPWPNKPRYRITSTGPKTKLKATDKAKQDREDLKQARAKLKAAEEDHEKQVRDLMKQLEQAHAKNSKSPRSTKTEAQLKINQLEAEVAKLRAASESNQVPKADPQGLTLTLTLTLIAIRSPKQIPRETSMQTG